MDAISVVQARVNVDGIFRNGEITTFPDGSQWFTWSATRGRSYSTRLFENA